MTDLQYRILQLSYANRRSHIGSCLTAVNILDDIYTQRKPDEPVILSAGHAGLALYVVLEKHLGLDAEDLLRRHGVHPTKSAADGIYCSTGSLGQGLSVAVGRALANRNRNVWVYITDGEFAEGVVWESLRFAQREQLWNLKVYMGHNGYGAYRETEWYGGEFLWNLYSGMRILGCDPMHWDIPFLKGQDAHYHVMTDADWAWVQENRPRRLTGIKIDGVEVREGDCVFGTQPGYYQHDYNRGDRCTAGVVFWSEHWSDWRILEGSFAEFYAGEKAGYPLAKLEKAILYPQPE